MKRSLWPLLLVFGLGCFGCGDDVSDAADAGRTDAGMVDGGAGTDGGPTGTAAFGATCAADTNCASNVCELFNMLGMVCTQTCTAETESDCPSGSQGRKCNMSGLCRP